jgi:hypothetical protein
MSGRSLASSPWRAAGLLLLLCIVLRLVLFHGQAAQFAPDSSTYVQAARDWLSGDYSVGQGRRTLGYPLVIALVGESPTVLLWANAVAGTISALLLFHIAFVLTRSTKAAFLAGALHTLNLQQLAQEALVLTETLSATTVIATLSAAVHVLQRWRAGRPALFGAVGLGVLATWALMTRPQFLFLPMLLPLAALWVMRSGRRWLPPAGALVPAAAVVLPAALLILAWASHLQAKTGHFTMSTQSGFGMVNHVIDYVELAPDRYRPARDVLQQVRDARIAAVGHSRNTIWYAWPEIQRVTGWSLPEASAEMQRMCVDLFAAYPGRYAMSVASAWVDFWTVPIFWQPESIRPPQLQTALQALWWIEHKLLRGANLAFVLLLAAVLVVPALRRRLRWDTELTVLSLTVIGSSLIQALADQGASSRYALPTQSVVVLVLVVALVRWRAGRAAPA